jgi:hypothetical protein
MPRVNVDLIGADGRVTGDLAGYMASKKKMDANRMRPFLGQDGGSYVSVYVGGDPTLKSNWIVKPSLNLNATLQRDEWKALDDAVVRAKEYRLGGFDEIISKGLTYNLGNAMGTTVLEWHDVSGELTADMTMDAITRTQNNRPDWNFNYIPIPIIHVDYEINSRELAASRNMGNPLDTTMAERAARAVQEKLENLLFTNLTYSYGEKDSRNNNTIYSFVNHPDRNQISLLNPWTDSATTGKDIVDEIISWKQASMDVRHFGPWMIFIPSGYETKLDQDYTGSTPDSNPNNTIRSRVMQISGILGVKVIDTLAADTILMVQMTSDVVRIIRGLPLQNVQWGEEGNFVTKFKVLTIQVPQIRSDPERRSGILHIV